MQGQGNGTDSSPLFFEYLGGFTVNNVQTYDTGVDTLNLDAYAASGNMTITNSTFQDNIPNITDRMVGIATISFASTTGNIFVEGNKILGSPQYGISVSDNNNYSLTIDDNSISQKGLVADDYGIRLVAVSNFQVIGNSIVTQSGEGILLDGYSSAADERRRD